ncbi:AraC family transcriptional regulator [Acaryochloris sp. IP29b_bin.148]|uniref:AraC family transcriptional regulator n=1 Tax=Acaryochloris sp. IP29b_bin.148 TaxID=2969218 RepID=UPI00260F46A1|nr:AraC family transcriptional regulator [Acaryochloris sp. IP29b_bin.148]
MFKDQNRQMSLDYLPQQHLPKWGRWVETPQLLAIFLPACQLQVNLVAPFDLISTRFKVGEGIAAFNSDQLKDYRAEPGGFDVIPKHSTYRSIEAMRGPSIVLAFKQPLRDSWIAHQLDHPLDLKPGQIRPTARGLAIAHATQALLTENSGDAFHLEALANLALGHVVNLHSRSNRSLRKLPDYLTPEKLNTVLSYIQDHLGDQLCLEQLASTIGLSTHYFAHAFKATTGIPPFQYLLRCRVAYAQSLLINTDLSLVKIAYDSGFGSQSHMTAVFSRILQITPLNYRQTIANKVYPIPLQFVEFSKFLAFAKRRISYNICMT